MKRAFTLIEMMIVVAVLVILMTITFKLMGLGASAECRTRTVTRMQRLENCLSGYYAAFGSYPPVKLHYNRDIYIKRDGEVQDENGDRNENIWNWTKIYQREEIQAWNQVELACRAQPLACRYPFPHNSKWNDYVKRVCENMQSYVQSLDFEEMDDTARAQITGGFDSIGGNPGRLGNSDKSDWNEIQVFQFGLMSFLLPRYLVMMSGDEEFYTRFAQWTENNKAPRDPFRGGAAANQSWGKVWRQAEQARQGKPRDIAQLANIPSQAACARWLPNLEKMCACNMPAGDISTKPFGVNLKSDAGEDQSELRYDAFEKSSDGKKLTKCTIKTFRPKGNSVGSNQYVLDGVTVHDGWGSEFFYYSPAPYQRYTLWSAGPNKRTFPPWISRGTLDSKANECVSLWIDDDIVHLAH